MFNLPIPWIVVQRICTPEQWNLKPELINAFVLSMMNSRVDHRSFSVRFLVFLWELQSSVLAKSGPNAALSPFGLVSARYVVSQRSWNISRRDPNCKMFSSQHISHHWARKALWASVKNRGLVPLKNNWLADTCTVRIMNVSLWNTFLCCKMSALTKAWESSKL